MSKAINKIIVYENKNFGGLTREFTSDVPDLASLNFNNCISSVKVIGQPWVGFERNNFRGQVSAFEEGKYSTIHLDNAISSLKLITENLEDPMITFYEHDNYGGKSLPCTSEQNLEYGNFDDEASSHTVQSGAWILYQNGPNEKGMRFLARAGENVAHYSDFDFSDRLSYVRPLKAGQPTVTSKVLWPQMIKGEETPAMIDQIIGVNYSDFPQEFTTQHSKEYEGSVTYEFKFSSKTIIEAGMELNIPLGSVSTSISNSINIKKEQRETITTREAVSISLPAKIPPHTKLHVNIMKLTSTVTVPVELTIDRNGKKKTESATLTCAQGNIIYAEYKSEKL
uniref:Epidermal differentiation-specific protein-like n=1 Tax=Geotrypetes seraphini TaxID=260995 RepID=A0A6P8P9S0_GEOSA|nr:epidermal differentiation-specific protein-like [Geotrypetes seraphini]